ncbi:MAG: hypothetical protein K6T72_10595, partial [Anoxybacillus sp.]|nr:hypothetical protein [Anoxybacillus sp.]
MELQDKKNQIKKLRKKAELSRNAHFMIANRLKLYSNCLHSFVLIGSTVTAILTFANYDAFLPIFKNLNDKVTAVDYPKLGILLPYIRAYSNKTAAI